LQERIRERKMKILAKKKLIAEQAQENIAPSSEDLALLQEMEAGLADDVGRLKGLEEEMKQLHASHDPNQLRRSLKKSRAKSRASLEDRLAHRRAKRAKLVAVGGGEQNETIAELEENIRDDESELVEIDREDVIEQAADVMNDVEVVEDQQESCDEKMQKLVQKASMQTQNLSLQLTEERQRHRSRLEERLNRRKAARRQLQGPKAPQDDGGAGEQGTHNSAIVMEDSKDGRAAVELQIARDKMAAAEIELEHLGSDFDDKKEELVQSLQREQSKHHKDLQARLAKRRKGKSPKKGRTRTASATASKERSVQQLQALQALSESSRKRFAAGNVKRDDQLIVLLNGLFDILGEESLELEVNPLEGRKRQRVVLKPLEEKSKEREQTPRAPEMVEKKEMAKIDVPRPPDAPNNSKTGSNYLKKLQGRRRKSSTK
jgi:hypothetical protein